MKLLHGFLFPRNGRYFSMKNITTQRLALGVLMALVLAFSLQNTVDALELKRSSRSGDLQTVGKGQNFEIQFSSGLKPTRTVTTGTGADRVRELYYDEEEIDIEVAHSTNATVTLKKVNNHDVTLTPTSGSPHTMYERSYENNEQPYNGMEDEHELGSSVRLIFSTDTPGIITITIDPTTGSSGSGTVPETVVDKMLKFTVFVAEHESNTFRAVRDVSNESPHLYQTTVPAVRDHERELTPLISDVTSPPTGTSSDNVWITLTVDGSGGVFLKKSYGIGDTESPDSESRPVKTLVTSSAVSDTDAPKVYLYVNGSTNRVTISALSSTGVKSKTTVFIYGAPTITAVNDGQTGAKGSRLASYLGALVKDRNNRAVPGAIVTFSDNVDGSFLPVPRTTVYVNNLTARVWQSVTSDDIREITATSNDPDSVATGVLVKTNSSGEAQVYYQIDGNASAGDINIVTASAIASKNFTIKVGSETSLAATLMIADGDGQSAAARETLENPLIIRLESGSGVNKRGIPNREITFSTDKGFFYG